MVRFVIGLFLVCFSVFASATFQLPDYLSYEDKTYKVDTYILNHYFYEYPDRLPESTSIVSNRWRGYVGHYEIKNNNLYVTDVTVLRFQPELPDEILGIDVSVIDEAFPEPSLRLASWYSGVIAIPLPVEPAPGSAEEKDVDADDADTNYLLFNVQNGAVVEQAQMTTAQYQQYQERQYEAFRQTNDYFETRQYALDLETEYALEDLNSGYSDPESDELVSEEIVEKRVRFESNFSERMTLPFKHQ